MAKKRADEPIFTEEDMRKVDKLIFEAVKKYTLIVLSAILSAWIIHQLFVYFRNL